MPPSSQAVNTQKVSELEEALSSVVARMDALTAEVRDSQKEIRDSQQDFRESQKDFRESQREANMRQERMESMFKQLMDSKQLQTCKRRGKRVEFQSQNVQVTNLYSVDDCVDLPESSNSSGLKKEDRDGLVRKVEMRVFEGIDAYGWISKVERFFQIGNYDDAEKMRLVSMSLDGRVLSWYNWHSNRKPFVSWFDFRQKLLSRFGAASSGSPNQRLFALKQSGSVDDFIHEFEELSSQVLSPWGTWGQPSSTASDKDTNADNGTPWVSLKETKRGEKDEKRRSQLLCAISHSSTGEDSDDEQYEDTLVKLPRRSTALSTLSDSFQKVLKTQVMYPIEEKDAEKCLGDERFSLVFRTRPIRDSYFISDSGGWTFLFWSVVGPDEKYLPKPQVSSLLRTAVGPIRDQLDHDLCWAFAVCDLVSSVRYLEGVDQNFMPLSPLFLCQNLSPERYRDICEATKTHGCYGIASVEEPLMYAQQFGVKRDSGGYEPFDCTKSKPFVSDELFKIKHIFIYETLELGLERLKTGYPVVAMLKLFHGWDTFHEAEIGDDMQIYFGPKDGDSFYTDHVVIMIEFRIIRGVKVAICKSSNGKKAANNGYIAVSLQIMLSTIGATKRVRKEEFFCSRGPQYLLSDCYSIDVETSTAEPRIKLDPDVAEANLKFKMAISDYFSGEFPRYAARSVGVLAATDSCLHDHIHLNKTLLQDWNISMQDILQKCEDIINSLGQKKKAEDFKRTNVSVSECFSFRDPCGRNDSDMPCLMLSSYNATDPDLEKTLDVLCNTIYLVLLETVIKGDPRICSANIIWNSPEMTRWIRNRHASRRGECGLDVTVEKSAVKQSGDAWRVVIDSCLPVLHLIDTKRAIPYSIKQVQELLGLSCAFDQAVQCLSASVRMVSKGGLKEYIILLANNMTCSGNMLVFNSGGYKALTRSLNIEAPFTEATLIAPRRCFEKAAEKCHTDSLSTVVGSCSWGKRVDVGTGSPFELLWNQKETGLVNEEETDVYSFLHMVGSTTNKNAYVSSPGFDVTEEEMAEWGQPSSTAADKDTNEDDGNPWVSLKETKSGEKDEKERSQWGNPAKRFPSDSWSNGGGGADCKGKRNHFPKLPGSVDNLAPMFTVTRQHLDLFTSEEQELLSDVEPIMRTLRKIMHQSEYPDGEPISDDDKTFVMEKILNFHPERDAKISSGVDYITGDKHTTFSDSRCFFTVSTDGAIQDFSYRKRLNNYLMEKYPNRAEQFFDKYFKISHPSGNRHRNNQDASTPQETQSQPPTQSIGDGGEDVQTQTQALSPSQAQSLSQTPAQSPSQTQT